MFDEKTNKDIGINLPKYKKALYDFYDSNKERFPFKGKEFEDDLLLVIYLNEYEYEHDFVLKALDDILIPNIKSKIALINVLSFLYGFGVINKIEYKKRNPYKGLF